MKVLMKYLKLLVARFKAAVSVIVRVIQKILITVLLFFLYFFGFGLTYFIMLIFRKATLLSLKTKQNSFWKEAQGYTVTMEECGRES